MAKVDLIALQSFYIGGNWTTQGETFSVNDGMVLEYTSRNLAKRTEELGTVEPAPEVAAEVTAEPATLEDMTAAQLKQAAKARGVHGYSTMAKQELFDALKGSI